MGCQVIDYDSEARDYDTSRGGEPRAQASADALEQLLPQGPCTILDIACGTGIVTRRADGSLCYRTRTRRARARCIASSP
ncbi:hypothetical protein AMK26_30345 [Streptomyces sp. CB03234]|nr:hypothetical protein AMK26_30345 [Streptomyces sp. CB03234]